MVKKKIAAWLLPVLFAGMIIFLWSLWSSSEDESEGVPHPPLEVSAWITDWAFASGWEDAAQLPGISALHWFAVYFDENDGFYTTPAWEQYFEDYRRLVSQVPGRSALITVVNDVWKADGTAVQKDADLISRLVASSDSRTNHMKGLLDLIVEMDADGLELDYENVHAADWGKYIQLIALLSDELLGMGKQLRVVLEPRAPIEKYDWPEGPEYVMMAYNLHGYHSGPGPKADIGFLKKLAARMGKMPGETVIALSLGGFAWSDGQVRALTEKEAQMLVQQFAVKPDRDEKSGARHFQYTDRNGQQTTVWYADHITLSRWISTLRELDIHKIALWRLGGMEEITIRALDRMDKK